MTNPAEDSFALRELLDALLPSEWNLELASRPTPSIDAVLVATDPSGTKYPMFIEYKSSVQPPDVPRLLAQFPGQRVLVVADYVSPRSRESLEQAKWGWVDLKSGEAKLAVGGLAINRQDPSGGRGRPPAAASRVRSLFKGGSLRIVRWLLIDPGRTWTVESLGEEAGVSPSFASRALATLAEAGWVTRRRGRYGGTDVVDPDGLLTEWARAEAPPSIVLERVSLLSSARQISLAVKDAANDAKYALTGESAAEFVNPFARYSVVDVYVDAPADWDKALSLTEVGKGGNVRLIVPSDHGVFDGARPQTPDQPTIVSLPQLYVDLIRRGGPAREAAEFMRSSRSLWPT